MHFGNMAVRKKIIFVLPLLYPGGAERALISLANHINRDGFESEMVVLDDRGSLKDWIYPDIPLHSLGGVSVFTGYLKLLKKLKELKPDIVMTTMVHSNFLLMFMKPFFPKTKFIIREAVVPSSILKKHKKKSLLLRALYKFLYPKADKVISPSQDIIDEFKTVIRIDTKNHRLLYNQVDTLSITNALQKNLVQEAKENTLNFVCAGRLHYQKGYDRLICALKDFKPACPWKLVIMGDGEERERLEALVVSLGLEQQVYFAGNVSIPWSIITNADCLLLPSRWEGMPNVVLESLFCGTPVIASADANGVSEIQSHCVIGDVQIAQNMDDFIQILLQVKPQTDVWPKTSKLPDIFQTHNVMRHFENILME